VTIGAIKKVTQSRITEKVYDKIWTFWDEHAPPKDEVEVPRAKAVKKVADAKPKTTA
jgi:hypothetical protein